MEVELHHSLKENVACKNMPNQQVTSRSKGEFQIKGRETIVSKIKKENPPNILILKRYTNTDTRGLLDNIQDQKGHLQL